MQEIRIQRLKKPRRDELEELVSWLCCSLGLVTQRDKDKTTERIFLALLKKQGVVRFDELLKEVRVSKSTLSHHLKKYIRYGILIRTREGYELREYSLEKTIEEIERDIIKEIERIKEVAKKIDELLYLNTE
jgi:predicted DNA-binding transcriptional regulator